MPISINEYRKPNFVKIQDRYPMTYDSKARYTDTVVNPDVAVLRAHSSTTGWKAPGYNPHDQSITIQRVNLTVDSPTFRPY